MKIITETTPANNICNNVTSAPLVLNNCNESLFTFNKSDVSIWLLLKFMLSV